MVTDSGTVAAEESSLLSLTMRALVVGPLRSIVPVVDPALSLMAVSPRVRLRLSRLSVAELRVKAIVSVPRTFPDPRLASYAVTVRM